MQVIIVSHALDSFIAIAAYQFPAGGCHLL